MGKGEFFGLFRRGLPPPAPLRLNPGGTGAGGAILHRAGGLPRRCRITLPSLSPTGGTAVLVAGFTSHITRFFPHPPIPPTPFPAGRGSFFVFLCKGLRPLHPRAKPGRHRNRGGASRADGGRGRGRGGLPWGRARTADCVSNSFGKSSWGFGGFFQEAPERFPAMVPGGKSLSRGTRERRITSAIHSGKVLGGLGASFKKPPTFFVSSFLRIFSVIPHLRSADSMT